MLVNHLLCKNKLLKNNAFTVKNDHQHPVDVSPDLLCVFLMWRRQAFPLWRLLFFCWVMTVNPGFVSGCSFPHMKQNSVQMCCSFISAIKKSHIAHHMRNHKRLLKRSTENYGCKTHCTNSEDSNTVASYGRKLFWVLGMNVGALEYAFILSWNIFINYSVWLLPFVNFIHFISF